MAGVINNNRMSSLDHFGKICVVALENMCLDIYADSDCDFESTYCNTIKYILRIIAVLVTAQRMSPSNKLFTDIQNAYNAILLSENHQCKCISAFENSVQAVYENSGIDIFNSVDSIHPDNITFCNITNALINPQANSLIEPLYFQTMPLSWLGCAYQHMLTHHFNSEKKLLEVNYSRRKKRGVYFTPPSLISYITESIVDGLTESADAEHTDINSICKLRILDPSMGGGDFLICIIKKLFSKLRTDSYNEKANAFAAIAANCVYGIDVDKLSVELTRFCVWCESGFADNITSLINSHIICGNTINPNKENLSAKHYFSEVFKNTFEPGFDAVIGNPPYIASKNGYSDNLKHIIKNGQSDAYLTFISTIIQQNFVKHGGYFSMVLPDPMLVRENAAGVRKELLQNWTLKSILHISNAFPDANVANVIPVCCNNKSEISTFLAARIDRSADRYNFSLRPSMTANQLSEKIRINTILAQNRCEILYLLDSGKFADVIKRIHGDNEKLSDYMVPFAPLESLNVKSIYRGEEVGKSAISSDFGDIPILMGGQSISRYAIKWEGRKIQLSKIRKQVNRYLSTKLLIQKSSAYVIAAVDVVSDEHSGYVFPQSVYGVELSKPGIDEYYLLCILNSAFMDEYIRRTVTGYKLLQPQLELEDIRSLPIRTISFVTPQDELEKLIDDGMDILSQDANLYNDKARLEKFGQFINNSLEPRNEKSDVVHSILSKLGQLIVELSNQQVNVPSFDITHKTNIIRRAIDIAVWCLYSGESYI